MCDPRLHDRIGCEGDLKRYLQIARDAMLWKLDGLSEYDVRRPLVPTGTNLLGLVKHLVCIEAGYFGETFGRPLDEPQHWWDENAEPNADMWATAEESRKDIVRLYRRTWAHADATIEARLLAVYGKTTGEPREAIRWYRLAVEAADRSDELAVRGWVRSRAAIALAYEGAALGVAEQLATQAVELSDEASIGRLNGLVAHAHVAAGRGNAAEAIRADEAARRVFDVVASPDAEISDFAVPPWRMATFRSMLYARLGDVRRGEEAQRDADDGRPAELVRFATHIELHRGLMMVHAGDREGGLAYARAAMDALPADRRSQTLRLVLDEVKRAAHTSA